MGRARLMEAGKTHCSGLSERKLATNSLSKGLSPDWFPESLPGKEDSSKEPTPLQFGKPHEASYHLCGESLSFSWWGVPSVCNSL